MANPEPQQESCCIIELDQYQIRRAEECTIFKVPWNIRKRDPDAYVPKIISLGPYHHRKRRLQAVNELKFYFLSLFLLRNHPVAPQDYLRKLKTLEEKVRRSYSEDIDMDSNEFVEMLLLDGCFVVEFLHQFGGDDCLHQFRGDDCLHQFRGGDYPRPFFKTLWAWNSIINDMIMLENQLPFFVLECIFDLAISTEIEQPKSLTRLAFKLCNSLFSNSIRMPVKEGEFYHLLHFLHSCLAPPPPLKESVPWFHHLLHLPHSCIARTQRQQKENAVTPTPESIPCAIQLAEAGVKFRTTEEEDKSFFDRYHLFHFLLSCIASTQRQQQKNAPPPPLKCSIPPPPPPRPPPMIRCSIPPPETRVNFRTTEKDKMIKCSIPPPPPPETRVNFRTTEKGKMIKCSIPPPEAPPPETRVNFRTTGKGKMIKCSMPLPETRVNFRTTEKVKCSIPPAKVGVNFRTTEEDKCSIPPAQICVNFRTTREDKSFSDITFGNGVLLIPTLKIYDNTNLLFRNLIAFEQCFPAGENHVAAYSAFMDCIIDTPRDVALLREKKVIVNCLGNDKDVAVLFNKLCKEVLINNKTGYLSDVFKDLTRYYSSRWPRHRQKLMHDYFNSPWSIISLVAAVILLLLTVIQTVLSVLPYFKPPK